MDMIVFNQQELDCVPENVKSVALCDNSFVIRPVHGREYIAIGKVDALVRCSAIAAIMSELVFIGFCPIFDEDADTVQCIQSAPPPSEQASFNSSFTSSFAASFATSFTTSFATSFSSMHEYEYELGSFAGSIRLNSSFAAGMASFRKTVVREIAVNGYGLNLI